MLRGSMISLMSALGLSAPALAEEPAPVLQFAFEEVVTLAPAVRLGETGRGVRQFIPITGGSFEGPGKDGEGIRGEIVPGGWDWQLVRSDGCVEIVADYMIRTDDDVVINVLNQGALCSDADGKPIPARTQPSFVAPVGRYDWLNKSAFIGTLALVEGSAVPAVRIRFYRAQ